MFKSKLKYLSLSLLLSGTLLYGGSEGIFSQYLGGNTSSAVTNLMSGGLNGSVNVNELVTNSNLPFEIECEPNVDLDFGNLTDICGAYRNLENKGNSTLSTLRKGFSFNGCSIAGSDRNTCRNNAIRKMCSGMENPDGKTVFGTASSNIKNKENMLYSGGDIYFKGNQCDFETKSILGDEVKYGKKTNKEVENEFLSPSIIASKQEAGGSSAFWKPGKLNLYETCIKNALNNGAKKPEESCKGEFYALPQTRLEAQEQIASTSRNSLKDSTSGLGKKVSDIEKTLKNTTYPNCTNVVNGECKDSSYVNNVKNKMDTMVKAEEMDRIKKTEEEMASFQEHVKIATMPKYEITYPTQEVLNGLHPEQKAEFVVLSNKQMHQKALFNSSIQNLTDLKKELIEISFKKAELSSKTFYPNAALEEAKKIMDSGF